jgi:D-glycero-alpha-D-manno-heptose-7-phosphate kinase
MSIFKIKGELTNLLKEAPIKTSAPCRVDMGGTLDIRSFYLPLGYLSPCTVNMALTLRTTVTLLPYDAGMIRVTSKGFDSAAFPLDTARFNHPLGLVFAVTSYFRGEGVHILIESASPPRSSLGGSSVAAVALVAAFGAAGAKIGLGPQLSPAQTALLAHAIEESVAGVPCGTQDQLAAAFGGINAWYWKDGLAGPAFEQKPLLREEGLSNFGKHLLVAYCGIPHESKNVNTRWVSRFLAGESRDKWAEITQLTHRFETAVKNLDIPVAINAMNREMAIRREMTPDVLDDIGELLVASANRSGCGARISGAGGGGCIWALGDPLSINNLRTVWEPILATRSDARLLDTGLDARGVRVEGEA